MRIFQIVSFGGNIEELLLHLIYICVIFLYIFLASYISQEIMDHNKDVFVTAYNIRWYLAPLHVQRMILFLLQRGSKAFNLNVGGVMIGSFENFASVKHLLEQFQQICNELKDENEIAIIQNYGINAKRLTTTLTLLNAVFFIIIQSMWLRFFNIFPFENESEEQMLFIMTEYFVDQGKYLHLILLHMNAAICVSLLGILATGSTLLTWLQYVCGMFKIASYRIEQTMEFNVQHNINLENVIMIYKHIICAVDIHRKAMKSVLIP
ncbi:PREDICTED: uncharacterized protein LOC106746662 [Dinoponera quadriceps]|uniref:Uncharacterized protein LOC106746662 n=1 Tax=Dinoponera quadriceps TaxID=609295 RepID=A0A6P3XLY1_DINQU|nr:PREDICTED: uncharacterized protein LOC106746662 [Dinoponera quadriceps]